MNSVSQRMSFWTYAFVFWVVLAIGSVALLYVKRDKLRFGIDLVGGTYMVLEVQTDKAIDSELAEHMQSFAEKFKREGIAQPKTKTIENQAIVLTFDSPDAVQKAASYFTLQEPTLKQSVEGNTISLRFDDKYAAKVRTDAVRNNVEVLHTRLNALGVEEIPISTQGEKNIVVELPNINDPQKAMAMIGKQGKLEFKLVEREGGTKEDILYKLEGEVLPPDKEIIYSNRDGRYYMVSRYAELTGKSLKNAYADLDPESRGVAIFFEFDSVGGDRLYELTKKSYGRKIAIILDSNVLMAPVVNEPLKRGGRITGGFTADQAKEYAILLKSGAVSAPVSFMGDRTVGPTLGTELIRKGLISCGVGMLLLLIFAVLFYKWCGLMSFLVLIYNLLLIMVGMYFLGATLTLPGIAGMVLTVGMAIDSSILIYERIREELKSGVTVHKAVNDGFSDALRVILDSNITTLLTGIILYIFGTGPIQGFAVTLMLGIASSLITGLFLLKTLLNVMIDTFDIKRLSI
jgi:preprotein translocase subunit SecD